MILLSAFQSLEYLPVEVNDLDGRRDELDFRADLLLAHGSERCSAALVAPLVFWQDDELLFMREIFQFCLIMQVYHVKSPFHTYS